MHLRARRLALCALVFIPTILLLSSYFQVFSWTRADKDSRYAYVLYATEQEYLCNAFINFKRLKSLNAVGADFVLVHPREWTSWSAWLEGHPNESIKTMLRTLKYRFGVRLRPVDLLEVQIGARTWKQSLTKLYILGMTEYRRIVYFDNDGLVLKNMDHLFLEPSAPLLLPRAYWMPNKTFATHIMVIEPSKNLWHDITAYLATSPERVYDMEIINHLFADIAKPLPHRGYALLTGEFRNPRHEAYLGNTTSSAPGWDPSRELAQSHYVHFSDWPLPKPWKPVRKQDLTKEWPKDDADREVWTGLYDLYREEKSNLCLPLRRFNPM